MNVSSGKYLYWNTDNTVTQKSLCDADRQLFKLERTAITGYYKIVASRNTAMALSVSTNSFAEGLPMIMQTKGTTTKGQEFYIEENGCDSSYNPKYGILTRVTGNFRGVEVYASSGAEGASVIQSLYYGNPNQQWVFVSVLEWPAKIFYDENCGYTATQLKDLYKQATLGILNRFKVDFALSTVQSSSVLTSVNCPNTTSSTGCSSDCGVVSTCHTTHHKSGPRYGNLMSVSGYYTCSFLRHRLCMYQNSGHFGNGSYILNGVGNVCGKETVVSTYDRLIDGDDAIVIHLQHELTHNLGATDAGCLSANMGTGKCALNGSIDSWCYNCETSIRTYLEGGA